MPTSGQPSRWGEGGHTPALYFRVSLLWHKVWGILIQSKLGLPMKWMGSPKYFPRAIQNCLSAELIKHLQLANRNDSHRVVPQLLFYLRDRTAKEMTDQAEDCSEGRCLPESNTDFNPSKGGRLWQCLPFVQQSSGQSTPPPQTSQTSRLEAPQLLLKLFNLD